MRPTPKEPRPKGAGNRQNERGFALLVVFLIAAGIMISLYLEMPRVAIRSSWRPTGAEDSIRIGKRA